MKVLKFQNHLRKLKNKMKNIPKDKVNKLFIKSYIYPGQCEMVK